MNAGRYTAGVDEVIIKDAQGARTAEGG